MFHHLGRPPGPLSLAHRRRKRIPVLLRGGFVIIARNSTLPLQPEQRAQRILVNKRHIAVSPARRLGVRAWGNLQLRIWPQCLLGSSHLNVLPCLSVLILVILVLVIVFLINNLLQQIRIPRRRPRRRIPPQLRNSRRQRLQLRIQRGDAAGETRIERLVLDRLARLGVRACLRVGMNRRRRVEAIDGDGGCCDVEGSRDELWTRH